MATGPGEQSQTDGQGAEGPQTDQDETETPRVQEPAAALRGPGHYARDEQSQWKRRVQTS